MDVIIASEHKTSIHKAAYVNTGFVLGGDDDIHFCPKFFKLDDKKQDQTFLHESSHKFAYTDDYNDRPPRWQEYPQDATWYEDFAIADARSLLDQFLNSFTRTYR